MTDNQPPAACADSLSLVDLVWKGARHGQRAAIKLLPLCDTCPVRESCWADSEWRDALKAAS